MRNFTSNKCFITTIVALLFCSVLHAEPFEVNGVNYNIVGSNTVRVIKKSGGYSGKVIIPSTVKKDNSGDVYSVTSIGEFAFEDCSGLTSIEIPSSVTSIEGGAFYGCSGLMSIEIPSSVMSIGEGAFMSCIGLTSISCNALEPPSTFLPFAGVDKSIPLYVPCESVEAYKAASEWEKFENIKCNVPTLVSESNASSAQKTLKYFENGRVVIERDGKMFDLRGVVVK